MYVNLGAVETETVDAAEAAVESIVEDTVEDIVRHVAEGERAAMAASALRRYLAKMWGRWPGWFTGVGAVQLPNGTYVIEIGIHPGIGRQTLPEVPSQVFGFPVILSKGLVSLRYPRRMKLTGGWPLTHYGNPLCTTDRWDSPRRCYMPRGGYPVRRGDPRRCGCWRP